MYPAAHHSSRSFAPHDAWEFSQVDTSYFHSNNTTSNQAPQAKSGAKRTIFLFSEEWEFLCFHCQFVEEEGHLLFQSEVA
mmetsp:Transcript_6426/g.24126  ORF Transcript_6426/g.24126 Transcript_6426/m.24126 type:complete len:80 (+) Transcript_6426:827-1066(+)